MNKYEYMHLLKEQLSIYDGNIDEIVKNYESIVNEMCDEGLRMDEVIERLGTPTDLAQEIVDELELAYSASYLEQVKLPKWAKVLLITCAIFGGIMLTPVITGIIMTISRLLLALLGALVAVIVTTIALTIAGITIAVFTILVPNISFLFKISLFLAIVSSVISMGIISYFMLYWSIQVSKKLFVTAKQLTLKIFEKLETWLNNKKGAFK